LRSQRGSPRIFWRGHTVVKWLWWRLANLVQMYPGVSERAAAYATFRYEGFIWLGVVLAGIAGSVVAQLIRQPAAGSRPNAVNPVDTAINRTGKVAGSVMLALVMAAAIGYIGLAIFVKGIASPTAGGNVASEPMVAQIAFGTLIAFGLAGFAVKAVFGFGWSIPLAAVAIVNFAVMTLGGNHKLLVQMAEKWPAATFAQASFAILPIQMVAYGTLGAVLGYWMAVRYNIWRTHVEVI
jgi:predicted small secreted protein